MSKTAAGLRRKTDGAGDLQSVVRTMKGVASSIIAQSERSAHALTEDYRTYNLNAPNGVHAPDSQRLLPQGEDWRRRLAAPRQRPGRG